MNTCHWTDQFAPLFIGLLIISITVVAIALAYEVLRPSRGKRKYYTHAEKRDYK